MRERLGLVGGLAEAASVIGHDAIAVREGCHLVAPHALVADASVQEDDRFAFPVFDARQARLADCHGKALHASAPRLLEGKIHAVAPFSADVPGALGAASLAKAEFR